LISLSTRHELERAFLWLVDASLPIGGHPTGKKEVRQKEAKIGTKTSSNTRNTYTIVSITN